MNHLGKKTFYTNIFKYLKYIHIYIAYICKYTCIYITYICKANISFYISFFPGMFIDLSLTSFSHVARFTYKNNFPNFSLYKEK